MVSKVLLSYERSVCPHWSSECDVPYKSAPGWEIGCYRGRFTIAVRFRVLATTKGQPSASGFSGEGPLNEHRHEYGQQSSRRSATAGCCAVAADRQVVRPGTMGRGVRR